MLEKRRLEDKKDDYASFRAEFYADRVVLGKYCLLLGELSTEFLELENEQLSKLREVTLLLLDATQKIYKPLDKIENEEDRHNVKQNDQDLPKGSKRLFYCALPQPFKITEGQGAFSFSVHILTSFHTFRRRVGYQRHKAAQRPCKGNIEQFISDHLRSGGH